MLYQLVEEVLASVAGSNITALEYRASGHRIRLERPQGGAQFAPASDGLSVSLPVPSAELQATVKPALVRAAMYGTFFRAASPDQAPLVEVGQAVEVGQQVGILEAMKTLHAVEAESAGIVHEIFVENSAAVDTGTVLLSIKEAVHG
ncbi:MULTISPECIES: biotin/lipoyl-containing protein [unclassified Acidovorax]|uniref:acetyl-CoA carboxylase biotin carboxyl carrier protein n=1 Tax=unclassified Acidovorax TaxID=2684926 RepID=UPI001C4488EA|nr:acetyl-CoA carboxylase biotin carboxyl carrier protein [Acidovorax sp. sif0732]MBV7451203.1 acetyl-CoA carboxylase biotin carboxyl carrier protein [Acidovorax sp. sif0715]